MKIFIHEKSEFIKKTGANRPMFEEIVIQKQFFRSKQFFYENISQRTFLVQLFKFVFIAFYNSHICGNFSI